MSKEAMKLALEALKYHTAQTRPIHQTNEAIKSLEEALAKQERKWVGLTDEEIERCKFDALNGTAWSMDVDIDLLVHEIAKKLKEKNT